MNSSSPPELLIEKYVYPLFLAETKEQLINRMTCGTIIYALLILLNLTHAPYGRYAKGSQKIRIPPKLAWIIQECPSFFVPLVLVYFGNRNEAFRSVANQMCLGMFMLHYFQR